MELAGKVRHEVGLHARIGLAHGKLTSRIVTQYLEQRDVMVLPPGKEVTFLGGLATRYLPLSADNQRRVAQLGLTKVRQFAALPGRGILPRFGYDGLRAYELAHGRDDARVRPWREEPPLAAEHVFPDPIANLRSLRYHVEKLTGRLARPLATRFQMAGALSLTITFEGGAVVTRERTLAEPATCPATLLVHADALLAQFTWGAPVERVALGVQGLCPTVGHQLDLFRRDHESQAGAERTLRRIEAKFGPAVVQQGRRLEPDSPLHERRAYLAPWSA
jgi:nucleotidyltransferase/DNA polymerase involved in DNA repair